MPSFIESLKALKLGKILTIIDKNKTDNKKSKSLAERNLYSKYRPKIWSRIGKKINAKTCVKQTDIKILAIAIIKASVIIRANIV